MCRLMQRYRWATEQKPNAGDQHRPPHSTATLQERMKMKVDWDELKRLHSEFMAGTCELRGSLSMASVILASFCVGLR